MINHFDNLEVFLTEIGGIIDSLYFEHNYLIDAVASVDYYNQEYYDSYIIGKTESWIIGFCFAGNYMLYGKDWTMEQIAITKKQLKLHSFNKGFHFSGTAELITEIFAENDYKLFKHRIFYLAENVTNASKLLLTPRLAKVEDLEILAQMTCDYFHDEYKGQNDKDFEKMKLSVLNSIKKKCLWVLVNDGQIVSMCSIILTQFDLPIIGSFYTIRKSRNKGFGTRLLEYVSNELLKEYNFIALLSDKDNIESNVVFKRLNFINKYETRDIIVK